MINFTVGPVQLDKRTRKIAQNQIPYFRTSEFSEVLKENEKLMCNFFDAPKNSRMIFLTGSGTAGLEASVMNFFSLKDKVFRVGHIGNISYREINKLVRVLKKILM